MTKELVLWNPQSSVNIPATVIKHSEIASYAKQLTKRELNQVVQAFDQGNYEMGSLFLWSKTMSVLKKQLGSLGMDFIGEMLDRTDVSSLSTATEVLTDYEAVRLAEELGMFTSTESMRLSQVMEMITFFSNPPEEGDDDRIMSFEESLRCLRTCVQGILGHERLQGAIEFARFRKELEEKTFSGEDEELQSLLGCPYFFRRTMLRVLLALAKTATGAQLEHALANLNLILPLLWRELLKSDRWVVGRAYAEVHAEGRKTAASGLRTALLKVKGFDYVPEDLRSRAFLDAAIRLQSAHFQMNNFYTEPAAIASLESLGTSFPGAAFAQCVTAVLCVSLGNHWGVSYGARDSAQRILGGISEDRWKYYLDECLPGDETILVKLQDPNIAQRWECLVKENSLNKLELHKKSSSDLLLYGAQGKTTIVSDIATKMYERLTTKKKLS